ncbi:MAG: DUF1800 domain-containing protein [Verrucomicrobiae bacterium]|nr:DUF1800 domain-containing protein [Verrucomicrobiae bacterium]
MDSRRWDLKDAARLLWRAGFGGPPHEAEALLALGPEGAVERLLGAPDAAALDEGPDLGLDSGDPMPRKRDRDALNAEEKKKALRLARAREAGGLATARGWWLARMADPAKAAREKMVLFLHGHFATSADKVRSPRLLLAQNRLFRRHAFGAWHDLCLGVAKDPAMLIYLDNAKSRAGNPNENFAREFFELFALGEGNYTEKDIQESARAFTGWSLATEMREFVIRKPWHDGGTKTVFGKTGNFGGEEIVGLTLKQPAAAALLAGKLWRFYAGSEPSAELREALAAELRDGGFNLGKFLRTIFRCGEFYDPSLDFLRIKSPVEWLVGLCRALEMPLPHPAVASFALAELGQDLFRPPNVKGWDGGLAWINTATLARREEIAASLIRGGRTENDWSRRAARRLAAFFAMGQESEMSGEARQEAQKRAFVETTRAPVDMTRILPRERRLSEEAVVGDLWWRLNGRMPAREDRDAALEAARKIEPTGVWTDDSAREMAVTLACAPSFQLSC